LDDLVGGGDDALGVTSWDFLAVPFVSAAKERWDASLVENMRVKRSFMEPFSLGFGCSGRRECPFWPFSFGDLEEASTDLIEGGCDERGDTRDEADASEFRDDVMVGCIDGNGIEEQFSGVGEEEKSASNDDARVDHRGRGCGRCGDASESCVGSSTLRLELMQATGSLAARNTRLG
jgi:hypothetical protein